MASRSSDPSVEPILFRFALWFTVLLLTGSAVFIAAFGDWTVVTIAVVVSLLAIAAGLLRRCSWARVLGNVFLVLLAVFVPVLAAAPTLERSKGPYPLERLLGVTSSTAVQLTIAIVVVLSFVLLGCVYLFGKHKTLFRRSAW